ncbi:hypothetical protein MCOR25_009261 [Pyricularia grisea]|nr:hypothetical protein MCOR25_009261 [Pyricularia grisea]
MLLESAQAIQNAQHEGKKAMKRRFPGAGGELNKVIHALELASDPRWSDKDEEEFLAEYQPAVAGLKELLEPASNKSTHTELSKLYKICWRTLGELPCTLLSAKYNLVAHTRTTFELQTTNGPVEITSPLLPSSYCSHLEHLVVYQRWAGKPDLLAVALQFAVISRTGDTRPWRINPTAGFRADSFLLERLSKASPQPPIALVRRLVDHHKPLTQFWPCMLDELLRFRPDTASPRVDNLEYQVQQVDLKNLAKAIGRVDATIPWAFNLTLPASATYAHRTISRKDAPSHEDLPDVLFKGVYGHMRKQALAMRQPVDVDIEMANTGNVQNNTFGDENDDPPSASGIHAPGADPAHDATDHASEDDWFTPQEDDDFGASPDRDAPDNRDASDNPPSDGALHTSAGPTKQGLGRKRGAEQISAVTDLSQTNKRIAIRTTRGPSSEVSDSQERPVSATPEIAELSRTQISPELEGPRWQTSPQLDHPVEEGQFSQQMSVESAGNSNEGDRIYNGMRGRFMGTNRKFIL